MQYIGTRSFNHYGDTADARVDEPLFECDELLAPTISILNKLGFNTSFCCSGHAFDYKEEGNGEVPFWRDSHCYICFTKSLEDMEQNGFIIPVGFEVMKSEDYFDVVEDDDPLWKVQIFKDFDQDESRFLQVLDNAKSLYTWACAMAYAQEKEHQKAAQLMEQIKIDIDSGEVVYLSEEDKEALKLHKITFYDEVRDANETVTVRDYLDFVVNLKTMFEDYKDDELSKRYKKIKEQYEHIRQRYLIPLLKPSQYVELADIIYANLEAMYGDLYDQYNDPTGSAIIGDKYYQYLDALIETVEKHIVQNYKVNH